MIAKVLDAWIRKRGGEIELADGAVTVQDEKAQRSYTVDADPLETLTERLKLALQEAKDKPREVDQP